MPIREQHNSQAPPNQARPYRRPDSPVVVFSGGSAPDPSVVAALPVERFVIAADGGHRHALDLGITVDLLVGDFDSLSPTDLDAAKRSETDVVQHRVDKDATDLELALDLAVERSPAEVVIVGGGEGERLDHFIGMISLLGDPRYAGTRMSAWLGHSLVVIVRPGQPATLTRSAADRADTTSTYVSLVPVTDTVEGVTTEGLRFALADATLSRHRTRGVSNEFTGDIPGASANVSITDGVLMVIQPQALPLPISSELPTSTSELPTSKAST